MRLLLLLCLVNNLAQAAIVYVRQDTSGLQLASLPDNLLSNCSQSCELTSGCGGFFVSGEQVCDLSSSPLAHSPSDIAFARAGYDMDTCPIGSEHFATVPPKTVLVSDPGAPSLAPVSDVLYANTTVSHVFTSPNQNPLTSSSSSSSSSTTATTNNPTTSTTFTSSSTKTVHETTSPTSSSTSTTTATVSSSASSQATSSSSTSSKVSSQSTRSESVPSTATAVKTTSVNGGATTDREHTTSTTLSSTASSSSGTTTVSSSVASKSTESTSGSSPASTERANGTSTGPTLSSSSSNAPRASSETIPSSTTTSSSSSSMSSSTATLTSTTTIERETTSTATSSSSTATLSTKTESATASPMSSTSTKKEPKTTSSSSTSTTTSTVPSSASSQPTSSSPSTSSVTSSSTMTTTGAPSSTTEIPASTSSSSTKTESTSTYSSSTTTITPTTTSMMTTTTESPTTTTPNALDTFTFVDVRGSNVSCFREKRTLGRFSTNGLCAMSGEDPCKAQGLTSLFGNCAGLKALTVVSPIQCVTTLSYSDSGLCVPWEAMFVDKVNPTAQGTLSSMRSCPTGLSNGVTCTPNPLGVQMMTGRYTDNLLGFLSNGTGAMVSTCYSTAPTIQASYCPVSPDYKSGTAYTCSHDSGNIGWTMTSGSDCSPPDFYANMGVAPCGKHSMLISGSGGQRCIGWDKGSTVTPFHETLKTISYWFVWDGVGKNYAKEQGPLLTYEEYMVLPRVLVTPIP